jgi:hypothetical protein
MNRRDELLSGRTRSALNSQMVAEHQAVDRAAKVTIGALMQSGGISDPPPRAEVDRVLGRTSPASAPTPADLPDVREANAAYRASAIKGAVPTVSPIARHLADQSGVLVSTVTGTGSGVYAVTLEDVKAAVAQQSQARTVLETGSWLTAAVDADARRVTRPSLFLPSQLVAVNEYGTNPLWEDVAQTNLEKAKAIVAAGDKPPTLFESGDSPVFLASGIPPAAVAAVPWPVRHVIARLINVDAAQLLNKFTPGPTSKPAALAEEALIFFSDDDENMEYRRRIAAWWENWKPIYGPEGVTGYKKHDPLKGWAGQ